MNLTPTEFELLLCEFCKQDLPPDFTIKHDIKDIGGESHGPRQIDTKIQGKVGISNILICGEAKNWSVPVDVGVIDAIVGKYFSGEIRANKVILFSNHGFTSTAISRGKHLGIELLEPKVLGTPIVGFPHIVGVGEIVQYRLRFSTNNPQQNLFPIDQNNLIILKGSERLSFYQYTFESMIHDLRQHEPKSILDDFSTHKIEDKNVLYELKQKERYKYHGDFSIEVSLEWQYFVEELRTGVLHHINNDESVYVDLHVSSEEVLKKVLKSPTKKNYNREECIIHFIEKGLDHNFLLFVLDPVRMKSDPSHPKFILI